MKLIVILFSSIYLWAASLFCIERPHVIHESITIKDYVEQYLCEVSEDINKEVPLDNYTDSVMVHAIEKVCQQRNLTVEQTFYVYKVFFL